MILTETMITALYDLHINATEGIESREESPKNTDAVNHMADIKLLTRKSEVKL